MRNNKGMIARYFPFKNESRPHSRRGFFIKCYLPIRDRQSIHQNFAVKAIAACTVASHRSLQPDRRVAVQKASGKPFLPSTPKQAHRKHNTEAAHARRRSRSSTRITQSSQTLCFPRPAPAQPHKKDPPCFDRPSFPAQHSSLPNIYTSRSYERDAFIAIGRGLLCVCSLRRIHSVCLYSRPKTSQGWYLTAPEFQTDIFSSLYSDTAHVMCTDSPGTMRPTKSPIGSVNFPKT
jgi:hypothetical protein